MVVGEGLRPPANVIGLLCVQARQMPITSAFAYGKLATSELIRKVAVLTQ